MQMEYTQLSLSNKKASRFVFGTAAPSIRGNEPEAACECLDLALEYGFTIFDSAHSYGNAEKNMGLWMQRRGCREQVILLDKGCNPGQAGSEDSLSASCILSQVRESLDRLQTDYLDLYLLHRDDPSVPVDEIVEVLNQLKEEGKILRFGGSNWTQDRIRQANEYAARRGLEGFTAVSPCFSLVPQIGDPACRSVCISGPAHQKERDWYASHNIAVFPYSSLARGFLSGKFRTSSPGLADQYLSPTTIQEYCYPENFRRLKQAEKLAEKKGASVSQISLAWMLRQPLPVFPIISPSTEAHIKDNLQAFSVSLTDEDMDFLQQDE